MSKSSYRAAVVRFLKEEDGPTAVEYAVMLALILLAVVGTVSIMAEETRKSFDKSSDAISGAFN
tara:strand:- start:213531 stop:213722 length:192 start_codon:yes stop_codon:yes gene_type:complete